MNPRRSLLTRTLGTAADYLSRGRLRALVILSLLMFATPAGAAPPPTKSAGPSLGKQTRTRDKRLDAKATEKSIKASIKNQEEILALEDKTSPSYPKQAMALADFYWDLADFYGNRVNSEEIEKPLYEAQQKQDQKGIEKWTREQQRLTDLKQKFQDETIKRYRDLAKRFPKAENLDEIRYFLAYNLTEMARGEEGVEEYMKIITDHPSSGYVPDALVNIGDYYFELNDHANALKLYQKAESFTEATIYGYAIYKQGWCLYNLQDYKASLARFVDVIELADKRVLEGQKGAIALKREAQNELVLPYAKVGKASDALKFLIDKAKAGDRYLTLAGRLASIYTEQGEYGKSTELLQLLMGEARKNAIDGKDQRYMVVQFQRLIVGNALESSDKKATVDEISNLIRLFESELDAAPEDFRASETEAIKRMILETAQLYHTEYNKTKDIKTLEFTQRLYDEYLRVFRKDENSYQLSMNNALLMLATEKYDAAAAEFENVIAMNPDGEFADAAAERSVLAYLKVVQFKGNKIKNEAEEDLKPRELEPEAKRFVTAIDRWMAIVARKGENPETKDNVPVARFAAAKVYYSANQFGEAARRFGEFLEKHSGHELENDARRHVLSSYNLASDIDNLRLYAKRFDGVTNLPSDLSDDIKKIKNAFDFQECQKIQTAKQHLEAAACFEKYARDFPQEARAADAIYNAALNYFEAKQVDKALQTQLMLYEKFKTAELAPKALFQIAEMYRQTTVYDEASKFYEFFVQNHPDHPLAVTALRYASIFRKTLGHYRQAISNLKTYLKKYPTDAQAPRVDLDIILIMEKQEQWPQLVNAANGHLNRYKNEPAGVRLQVMHKRGLAFLKQRMMREAAQAFDETVKTFLALDERFVRDLDMPAVSAIAESHFQLGETELHRARAIKLEGRTDKTVNEAVTQKLAIMGKVKDTYEKVIAYGHPGWVIAASTQLGTAYQDLADAMENAPIPTSLRGIPEAEDAHRQDMAAQAEKIRQTALANYRRALDTSRESRWFNEYSEKAERAIAQLDLEDKSVKEFRLRPSKVTPNGGLPLFSRGL
jgi:tetratricopeptide (TPR) repeat protein